MVKQTTKVLTSILVHATFNVIVTILFSIWATKAWKEYPDLVKYRVGIIPSKMDDGQTT